MQPNQVKEEFPTIERYIDNVAQLCQSSSNVPEDLRHCLSELERESDQAMSMLQQEQTLNDQRIVDCIDHLEKLGDRAMQSCRQAANVDEQVQKAVQQAHGALSELKHRLH